MNADKLARTTFVLHRETHEQLQRIARKFGVSRSELVRDVLEEPVALMAKWADRVPANPTPEEKAALLSGMAADLGTLIDKEMETIRHG